MHNICMGRLKTMLKTQHASSESDLENRNVNLVGVPFDFACVKEDESQTHPPTPRGRGRGREKADAQQFITREILASKRTLTQKAL